MPFELFLLGWPMAVSTFWVLRHLVQTKFTVVFKTRLLNLGMIDTLANITQKITTGALNVSTAIGSN